MLRIPIQPPEIMIYFTLAKLIVRFRSALLKFREGVESFDSYPIDDRTMNIHRVRFTGSYNSVAVFRFDFIASLSWSGLVGLERRQFVLHLNLTLFAVLRLAGVV